MSEPWVRAGRAAVIVVALTMAAISYAHIRDLALAYGGDGLTAPLLPLGIDGAVAAMTVFMHQASGLALHLARCVLIAAVGMTVACNTAYGAAYGVTGALLWSSPAVLFVGCVEVSVLMVRKTRPAAPERAPATAPALNGKAHPERTRRPPRKPVRSAPDPFSLFAETLALGALPSRRQIRSRMHVGQERAGAIHAELATSLNGKAHL